MTEDTGKEEKEFEEEQKRLRKTIGSKLVGGKLCVFIGAGMSAGVVPTWVKFVKECIKETGVSLDEDIWNKKDLDGLKDVYDMCVGMESGAEAVAKGLHRAIDESNELIRAAVHQLISLPKLRLYVTTNFDHSLMELLRGKEDTDVVRYIGNELGNLSKDRLRMSVYFIHGYKKAEEQWQPDHLETDIVLGRASFNHAYYLKPRSEAQLGGDGSSQAMKKDGPVSSFIQELLKNHDVLFLGFNPTERDFRKVMDTMQNSRTQNKGQRKHYIVLPKHTEELLRRLYDEQDSIQSFAEFDAIDDEGRRSMAAAELPESKQADAATDMGFSVCYYKLEYKDKHDGFNALIKEWVDGPGGAHTPSFRESKPKALGAADEQQGQEGGRGHD